ncbi:hypothetical protein PL321_10690 [Caloramator sp. mosi_1]|uniref:hypothetical protein n=1 Tax=Caloramator sp. mosi_1 TaxID=3023090 RepID=UPI0023615E24|nr:hypothetical protein [Caloramator sp. mosi_1]WDC83254.1 hypothetical protein PL321_10690 [Caloramator sp. mosi_1]
MMDERWRQGMYVFPFAPFTNYYDLKQEHDTYRIYVNGDYVGNKTLLSQGEDIKDIEGFLKSRGYKNIASQIEGNMYNIEVADELLEEIKRNLNVYLNNR